MTDHAQLMVDKLLAQFGSSPKLESLVRVLGNRLNVLEKTIAALQEKRWIDTAEAVQLDGCGAIVAQSRLVSKAIALPFFGFIDQPAARGFGKARFRGRLESHLSTATLADPEYRKMIKAKVAKNISWGTTEETIASYQHIFDAPKVVITEMGNAKLRVGIARELTEGERIFAQALDLFVCPGGVGVDLRTSFDSRRTFGFRDQGLQGFDVGKFAESF
ncbi:DUF2612 domain-containing protein [Anaeroarcus burkinensis]|uniref:DUF2612 domain-containing protein n=1 Tax=Anaeroarcus burkinensis TaxID=82376 RepID=UPI000484ED8F|nr:DUF2612 domain-containing protein [Anaeroarcus burkinensis]